MITLQFASLLQQQIDRLKLSAALPSLSDGRKVLTNQQTAFRATVVFVELSALLGARSPSPDSPPPPRDGAPKRHGLSPPRRMPLAA